MTRVRRRPGGARPAQARTAAPLAALAVLAGTLAGTLALVPATASVTMAATSPSPTDVLAHLTEAQRVGQLIMVGASLDGVSTTTKTAISRYHAGSVILVGRSDAGVAAVHAMTARLQRLATAQATGGVGLFVSTDQEGGEVQALSGTGFSVMPTALQQGQLPPSTLRADAKTWGKQLAAAGVNLNLAPVLDTVPRPNATSNQPIGRYHREFGHNPTIVTTAGLAFVRGMHDAAVETAIKHFPGLGRANGNTDYADGVTDVVTTRHDAYLAPYAAAISKASAEVVMVSLATYTRIDPHHRAVFSSSVLRGMLRHDLGFTGVIISDSLDAKAVHDLTPGQRAVRFVRAGGDLVLTTHPADVPAMTSALLNRAKSDASFRAAIDTACRRVLIAKQRAGLLS